MLGHATGKLMRRASRLVAVVHSADSTPALSSSRASSSSSSISSSSLSSSPHRYRRSRKDEAPSGMGTGCRGRSFTTSDPLHSGKYTKRKRLPKDERRAMVEAFVEKYRNANAGKFPAICYTRNQVGGSFYVIKDILQMLEYESKNPSIKKQEKTISEQHIGKNVNVMEQDKNTLTSENPTSLDESSQSTYIEDGAITVPENTVLDENLSMNVVENSTRCSTSHVRPLDNEKKKQLNHARDSNSFYVEPFDHGTCTSNSSEKHSTEVETSKDIGSDFKVLQQEVSQKPQPVNQEIPISQHVHRDASGKLGDGQPSPKSTSAWSNLKSLLAGIISSWKKS